MKNKMKLLCILICLVSNLSVFAQKRFQSEIFTTTDSLTNIQYGQAFNLKGKDEKLLLDIIMPPKTDSLKYRPLLIFIHGGGFKNNSKNGSYS